MDKIVVLYVAHAVAHKVSEGHLRQFRNGVAVSLNDGGNGGARAFLLEPSSARSQFDRSGKPLEVPLEGCANGFVKIVDVEDESAVGSGVGAEISDVGV